MGNAAALVVLDRATNFVGMYPVGSKTAKSTPWKR
jgi:hypothetical protein